MTKFKHFKKVLYAVSFILIGSVLYGASNIFTDLWTINGVGSLRNSAIAYIDSSYGFFLQDDGSTPDFSVQSGNTYVGNRLYYGSLGVAVSTTNTAGASRAGTYTAYLAATPVESAAVEGDSLCVSTVASGAYVTVKVCEPSVALKTWVGVAAAAASTGAVVSVYNDGWVLARTTGTVAVGDLLATTNLGGGLLATTTNSTHNVVGVALNTLISTEGALRLRVKLK